MPFHPNRDAMGRLHVSAPVRTPPGLPAVNTGDPHHKFVTKSSRLPACGPFGPCIFHLGSSGGDLIPCIISGDAAESPSKIFPRRRSLMDRNSRKPLLAATCRSCGPPTEHRMRLDRAAASLTHLCACAPQIKAAHQPGQGPCP